MHVFWPVGAKLANVARNGEHGFLGAVLVGPSQMKDPEPQIPHVEIDKPVVVVRILSWD